jgi:hypothetical protein
VISPRRYEYCLDPSYIAYAYVNGTAKWYRSDSETIANVESERQHMATATKHLGFSVYAETRGSEVPSYERVHRSC